MKVRRELKKYAFLEERKKEGRTEGREGGKEEGRKVRQANKCQ